MALAMTMSAGFAPCAAGAQARFTWPDTAVDVSRYTTVEECLAAVQRADYGQRVRDALTVWSDTLTEQARWRLKHATPAPVAATATRCVARFPERTANLDDYMMLLPLYLDAGRDSDAVALTARRLAALPSTTSRRTRGAVVDSIVEVYMTARPPRLAAAETLLAQSSHGASRPERVKIAIAMMGQALRIGDSVHARPLARTAVALDDSLTDADRHSKEFTQWLGVSDRADLFDAMRLLDGERLLLDSLRRSTAAFAALERSVWTWAAKGLGVEFPRLVGERAPAIKADFWFPSAAASEAWPRRGHVSLIVFIECDTGPRPDDAHPPGDGPCGAEGVLLRHFAERFPTLDIVLVSHTHGFLEYLPPPAPAEEAAWMDKWVKAWVPSATLAIGTGSFWRLPGADRRLIGQDIANDTSYTFGRRFQLKDYGDPNEYFLQSYATQAFLVDPDGIVVDNEPFVYGTESWLGALIDALLHRASATASTGAPK